MILGQAPDFAPDAVELGLADPEAARAFVAGRSPAMLEAIAARHARLDAHFGQAAETGRAGDALVLALARFGRRHGSWGEDYHDYHNEEHALEILIGRLDMLIAAVGLEAMPLADWLALELFAGCHDLRQRETPAPDQAIGNNEAASIAECFRIMAASGYRSSADRGQFVALQLMIAGSTFDARPSPPPMRYNPAEVVASGGALAPKLPQVLDLESPGWNADPHALRGLGLALLASDLDTANVGEPFADLADSAARLARERERLADRELDDPASGPPCLNFLSSGQERYFFELHRFTSELGERAFAAGKARNAPRVREASAALRAHFAGREAFTANDVLARFAELAI